MASLQKQYEHVVREKERSEQDYVADAGGILLQVTSSDEHTADRQGCPDFYNNTKGKDENRGTVVLSGLFAISGADLLSPLKAFKGVNKEK